MFELKDTKLHSYIANEKYILLNNEVKLAISLELPEGYYWKGKMYQHGFGVEKNMDKAIECYEKASEMYCGDATIHLASLCYFGIGVEKNYDKAYQLALLACEQQNVYAQLIVALYCGNDILDGIEKNLTKALFLAKTAYNNGLEIANKVLKNYKLRTIHIGKQDSLGGEGYLSQLFREVDEYSLYFNATDGIGYRKAARRRVIKGLCDYGYWIETVEKDVHKAILKYNECISNEYYYAYGGIGRCYEYIDIDKALRYYRKAVQYGYSEFNENIHRILTDGKYLLEMGNIVRKNNNLELAGDYFNRAYKGPIGDEAYYYLGLWSYDWEIKRKKKDVDEIYQNNKDKWHFELYDDIKKMETQRIERTFDYFYRASKLNNPVALLVVAYCYYYGRGVETNEEKAKEYCELARQYGFVSSFRNLDIKKNDYLQIIKLLRIIDTNASSYLLGYLLLESDPETSIRMFKRCAKNEYVDSNKIYIEVCMKHPDLCKSKFDVEMVKQLLIEGSIFNNKDASYILGICYEKGLFDMEKDEKLSQAYFREALE